MSKTVTLQAKLELFRDALDNPLTGSFHDFRYGIPDFQVMEKLECTPQSWSRYRPKIIEYCRNYELIKTEKQGDVEVETIRISMKYDKRNRMWYGKRNPLRLYDVDATVRDLTEEEFVKYGIVYYSVQDYQY